MKTLRLKLMVSLLPFVLIVLVALSLVSYQYSTSVITSEIGKAMDLQLASTIGNIETQVDIHKRTVETLARSVEVDRSILTPPQYEELLKRVLATDANAYGVGLWFEPYQYQTNQKYFGPYVYRDHGKSIVTYEYSTASYDYPHWDWYQLGKKTDQATAMTAPYVDDVSKVTMLTNAAPFYDEQGKFLGEATLDVDLTNIQNLVKQIHIPNGGWAFLVDNTGTYVASPNPQQVIKQAKISNESNQSLAHQANVILSSSNGVTQFAQNGNTDSIYFASVPNTNWKLGMVVPDSYLHQDINALLSRLIPIVIGAVLLVALFIYFLSQYLTANLKRIDDLSNLVSSGDLTQSIEINSQDELGHVARNISAMVGNLRGLIMKVHSGAERVGATSEQLNASMEETTQRTDHIALSMQEVAMGAEKQSSITQESKEISFSVFTQMNHIAETVTEITDSVVQASTTAELGTKLAKDTVQQMNEIKAKIDASATSANRLQDSSKRIGTIVAYITDAAAQTNLLSLNAAIEAARAGEQGRGFAVVAEEVRKLAASSHQAAEEISSLVTNIQDSVSEVVSSMNDGTAAIYDGIAMVGRTENSFAEIAVSVKTVTGQMQDFINVVNKTRNQMQSMVEFMDKMLKITSDSACNTEEIAAAVEEQTATMQEISAASTELSQMALSLLESITEFKLV